MESKKVSSRELDNELRNRYALMILSSLTSVGEDVAIIGNGVLNIPCLTVNGDESAVEISIKVPKGERIAKEDGGGFSGYDYATAREDWNSLVEQKRMDAEKKKTKKDKTGKKEEK